MPRKFNQVADKAKHRELHRLANARHLLHWCPPLLGLLLWSPIVFLFMEENFGLQALFAWRGELSAPRDVVVVAINEDSDDLLSQPDRRARYAQVVDRLATAGASIVVFDMFLESETSRDADLAEALRAHRNVILTARLDDRDMQIQPLVPMLSSSAFGIATLPVPTKGFRLDWIDLNYMIDQNVEYAAPFMALQGHIYNEWVSLLRSVAPEIGETYPETRDELPPNTTLNQLVNDFHELFQNVPRIRRDAVHAPDPASESLASVYGDNGLLIGSRLYLNFYGGPRTITTISFEDAHAGRLSVADGTDVEGKAVFVGYSAARQQDERDAYPYVFSRDGLDLAGVELGATAFANLLYGDAIRLPPHYVRTILAVAWGLLVVATFSLLRVRLSLIAVLGLCGVYVYIALSIFSSYGVWLPLVVPASQVAFAGLLSLRVKQLQERRLLGTGTTREAALALTRRGKAEKVDQRVILYADQQGSKRWLDHVQKNLDVVSYRELETEFVNVRDGPIEAHGGEVNHFLADSMLAYWVTLESQDSVRLQMNAACRAVLDIQDGLQEFNRRRDGYGLHMRFGLDWSRIWSHLSASRFIKDWRMAGKAIHVAERLESLNKVLKTWILVSDRVADRIDRTEFWAPKVGTFVFCNEDGETVAGPVAVHELRRNEGVTSETRELATTMAAALNAAEHQNWPFAIAAFDEIKHAPGYTNMASRYLTWCYESQREMPGGKWHGNVMVTFDDKLQVLERYLEQAVTQGIPDSD